MLMSHKIRILSTGSCVPERRVTNEDITGLAGSSASWVRERLGIAARRVVDTDTLASDLATQAATVALERAGLAPEEIDLIIVATATPDRKAPSTACIVKSKLGIQNTSPAFDLNAVCSGFLYAFEAATALMLASAHKNALVVGVDTFSLITDWRHRNAVFFGDGAGAIVLQYSDKFNGFLSLETHSQTRFPYEFTVPPGSSHFQMTGRSVLEMAKETLPDAIRRHLHNHSLDLSDIRFIVPHQPSLPVLQSLASELGIPISRISTNLEEYANTAAATIPLLLDEMATNKLINGGDNVLFAALGSGWTWGIGVYRWH